LRTSIVLIRQMPDGTDDKRIGAEPGVALVLEGDFQASGLGPRGRQSLYALLPRLNSRAT
jgi:hypothetical protein